MTTRTAHTILFVADQGESTEFYKSVLQLPPRLDGSGMTEFEVTEAVFQAL